MGTHGVLVIKDEEWIWGFHGFYDGANVGQFYEQNKGLKDTKEILFKALEFYAEGSYEDKSYLNFYREKYNENKDYKDITHHTLYFDGENWYLNSW